jgi:ribosome-binding protein aMBF1 (putative translation factor)
MSESNRDSEQVARAVQEALRDAPFSLRDLAEDMNGSYGTMREWSRGARTPTNASAERIATSLERRASIIMLIAERLRDAIARRKQ